MFWVLGSMFWTLDTIQIKINSSERMMISKRETKKNNWDSLSKHSRMMEFNNNQQQIVKPIFIEIG